MSQKKESTKDVRIRRADKGRENPYAQVRRATLEDDRLSWEARGILAYVLAKPNDWEVQMTDLINASPAGRDCNYRIVNELIHFGYFERVPIRNKGRFQGYEILVYEEPLFVEDESQTGLPDTAQPDTAQPDTASPDTAQPFPENPDHNNKEHRLNTNMNKELNKQTTNMNKEPGVEERVVDVVVVSSLCSDVDVDDVGVDDVDEVDEVEILLDRYGVSTHMIAKYRQQYDAAYLLQKIHYLEFSMKQRTIQNTAGWLCNAIKNDYDEPHGYFPPVNGSTGQQTAFQPVSEPVSGSDEELANGSDGQAVSLSASQPVSPPELDLREETEQLLRAEQYGTVSHEQAMAWAGSVVCMERHVNALPKLLGVLGNCLTIGVSAFDMSFLSGRGAALIERQLQRFGGGWSYELVMV
ncbi:MAG: hypothetical protein AAF639_33930 [Chloroflexota bacterium]